MGAEEEKLVLVVIEEMELGIMATEEIEFVVVTEEVELIVVTGGHGISDTDWAGLVIIPLVSSSKLVSMLVDVVVVSETILLLVGILTGQSSLFLVSIITDLS